MSLSPILSERSIIQREPAACLGSHSKVMAAPDLHDISLESQPLRPCAVQYGPITTWAHSNWGSILKLVPQLY